MYYHMIFIIIMYHLELTPKSYELLMNHCQALLTKWKCCRVWNTEWWEAEAWNTIGGDVVATAWSPLPYGILLFATRTEPFLYAMPSSTANLYPALDAQARTASLVVADFSPVQLPSGEW
jgi:hypothetical protein